MLPMNWSPEHAQVRSFSRTWLPLFVVVVSGLLYRRLGPTSVTFWVAGVGALVAGASALSHQVGRAVFLGLQVVTFPIALVVSTVVLAAIYYLVVTPIGVALRLLGHDLLGLRRPGRGWVPVRQDTDPERAFRQF
jgi:hypothetical protein